MNRHACAKCFGVVPAKPRGARREPGPITTALTIRNRHGLWVPAFAGTTAARHFHLPSPLVGEGGARGANAKREPGEGSASVGWAKARSAEPTDLFEIGIYFAGGHASLWPPYELPNQPQKYRDGLIQARDVAVIELPDAVADLALGHSENLVHHDAGREIETIQCAGFDGDAEQWHLRGVAGEAANRDGIEKFKMLVLNDDGRTWLAAVVRSACARPNLPARQSAFQSDIESTQA